MRNERGFAWLPLVVIIGLVIIVVGGVYLYTQSNQSLGINPNDLFQSATSTNPATTNWYVSKEAIQQLQSVQTPTALVNTLFNNPNTYSNDLADLPNATPTETFTSFADFQTAIDKNKIGSSVKVILYDNEHWSFTPLSEQQNPALYAQKAATLAHAHGLKLIFTPAADLVAVLAPGSTNKYDAFLALNILGQSAKYVDVVEIQVQGAQGTPEFAAFVNKAVAQIRAVSATVNILAGLNSELTGRTVTSAQLIDDFNATKTYVNGYWLNIPAKSSYCPSCGTGNPTVARDFLRAISASTQSVNGTPAQTAAQSGGVVIPITQRIFQGGVIRYSIPVVIGGKTINAMLDTGSTGLRVLKSALPASGYTISSTPSTVVYGGPILTGVVARATITIGGVAIDAPLEAVDSITCIPTSPNCDTSSIFGYDAIIGVGMRGQDVPNPFALTTSATWILNLPLPGSSASGQLILNPTQSDTAGYTIFQLARQTTSDVGAGIMPEWASNQLSVCISRSDTGLFICKGTSFDTGAFNVKAIPAGTATSWPTGTPATITIINTAGTQMTDPFIVGSGPGSKVFLDKTAVTNARNLNTGPLPFFHFSVLYDFKDGAIGLSAR